MDEQAALALVADRLSAAGDDAAVVDGLVLTTDMLHETTDFPQGTTRYTAGWRAVGASLSDVAAMGAMAVAAVAVYGAPRFEPDDLTAFVDGAAAVCSRADAAYVGGDLDHHEEFTVATAAVGRTDAPVRRRGASPGETVCVTGTLGRSAGALRLFEAGEVERANDLFRFTPRIAAGRQLAAHATAMIDSSDGLARSLHQLAAASDCGFAIASDDLPIDPVLETVADGPETIRQLATTFGEDFELVATLPRAQLDTVRSAVDVSVTPIGEVTETASGVTLDGEPLPDEGYTHSPSEAG